MTRRTWLLAVWTVAAAVFVGALVIAQIGKNPLNDPDLAYQRPGFLDAHGTPFPAPAVTERIPAVDARTVVFFTRAERAAMLRAALATHPSLADRAQLVIVAAGVVPDAAAGGIPTITDPDGRLAAAYQMPVPADHGPPVGYAIVDRSGQVRYRTLDPNMADLLNEVETMVRATP